jgi:hypothetical protein
MKEVDTQEQSAAACEMPRYKCHKEVWALKIAGVHVDHPSCKEDGAALLTPTDTTYAPFLVSSDYVETHKPQVGGYYVVYKDGYKSYSPAAPFESGYSLVGG